MTKTFLKPFSRLISLAALLLMPVYKVNTCVENYAEDQIWIFQPDIAGFPSLHPFNYTYRQFYGENNDTLSYTRNTIEWYQEMQQAVPQSDIHEILYNTDPDSLLTSDPNNAFLHALQQPANSELYQYLVFAKKCETVFNFQPWKESLNTSMLDNLIKAGESLLEKSRSKFVRLRTAYQILKAHRYKGDASEGNKIYEAYIKNAPTNSWIKGSAVFMLAAVEKDSIVRNYKLARAFDASPEHRNAIGIAYRHDLLPQTLELARSDHERAVVRLIAALENPGPGLADMKTVYSLDPAYPELSMLIAREINKLEDWILKDQLTAVGPGSVLTGDSHGALSWRESVKSKEHDARYLKEVKAFAEQVIRDGKRIDKHFWFLAGSYLAVLDADFQKAREYLEAARQCNYSDQTFQTQLAITDAFVAVLEGLEWTPAAETAILKLFNFIEHDQAYSKARDLKANLLLFFSRQLINRHKVAAGSILLAKCPEKVWGTWRNAGMVPKSGFYHKLLEIGQPADFDEAVRILKTPKSPFEKWLTADPQPYPNFNEYFYHDFDKEPPVQKHRWDIDKIWDYKSIYYVKNDNLDSALIALANIRNSYWTVWPQKDELNGSPFDIGIKTEGVDFNSKELACNHSKYTFFQKLIRLKKDTSDATTRQQNLVMTANAYYNMTYQGKWWLCNTVSKSSAEFYFDTPEDYTPEASQPKPNDNISSKYYLGFLAVSLVLFFLGFMIKRKVLLLMGGIFSILSLYYFFHKLPVTANISTPKSAVVDSRAAMARFNADPYYNCSRAKAYYLKAIAANPATELAAMAAMMAGKCDANSAYEVTLGDQFKPDSIQSRYVQLLGKHQYKENMSCMSFSNFLKVHGLKVVK